MEPIFFIQAIDNLGLLITLVECIEGAIFLMAIEMFKCSEQVLSNSHSRESISTHSIDGVLAWGISSPSVSS